MSARRACRSRARRTLRASSHQRSASSTSEARSSLLAGVPMSWMAHVGRRLPGLPRAGARRDDRRRGRERVRRLLPWRHRRDGGPLARSRPCGRSPAIEAASRRCCPPRTPPGWGRELARRFGVPYWQFALTATDANRWMLRMCRHVTAPPAGGGLQLVLPRLGGRGLRDARRGRRARGRATGSSARRGPGARPPAWPSSTTSTPSSAVLAHGDVACLLMEPALTNIGIVLPEPGFLGGVREACTAARHAPRSSTRRTR